MVERINQSGASVLVVGLGAGRQEKFIVRQRERLPLVKTFLPLGGTIDYEARTLERPASWVTDSGLEWLYRLVSEPRLRWRRYLIHQPPVLYYLTLQRLGLYRESLRRAPVNFSARLHMVIYGCNSGTWHRAGQKAISAAAPVGGLKEPGRVLP